MKTHMSSRRYSSGRVYFSSTRRGACGLVAPTQTEEWSEVTCSRCLRLRR